tara:strand:- start:34 stop:549 length:516 start_codon:yes stop_codon:yes gene_type:complete
MNSLKFKYLSEIDFTKFKEFLDSLDEEKKSWSLDLQGHKDAKEMYDDSLNIPFVILCLDGDLVIGLVSVNIVAYDNIKNDLEYRYFKDKNFKNGAIISFVVKSNYQGKNIGTQLLVQMEDVLRELEFINFEFIFAKHYKDNIASHKAFLKAGYKELSNNYDNNFNWKLKEL